MSGKVDNKASDLEKLLPRLIKLDPNNSEIISMQKNAKSSRKFQYTKRKINGICRSLSYDSDEYDPDKTLSSIEAFLVAEDNMGRILYSEVSSYVFSLSDGERDTFSANIEKLLMCVLKEDTKESGDKGGFDDIDEVHDDADSVKKQEDVKKFVIKLFDHSQLVLYQINNTDKQYAKSIETTRQELQTEVKGMEKEYISILGIFASIVLAFIGGMTFSTSVLENIASASIYRVIILTLIIAFVFLNMIWLLMDFIRAINGNSIKRQSIIWWLDIGIGIAIALMCVACHFGWLEHECMAPRFGQEIEIIDESIDAKETELEEGFEPQNIDTKENVNEDISVESEAVEDSGETTVSSSSQ